MRKLTDHIVNGCNEQLEIEVTDEPGSGGANHCYRVDGFELTKRPSENAVAIVGRTDIHFQNGPIKEAGVNGITHEVLLAILIDRLRGFQSGPFANRDNAIALTHLEDALLRLQKRTNDRLKRGVEGTHQK